MVQKLDTLALGYSLSILSGLGMLALGILGSLGLYVVGVEMMQKWHLFFSPSLIGIITGTIEAMVYGFIGGWLIAYFYNKFA